MSEEPPPSYNNDEPTDQSRLILIGLGVLGVVLFVLFASPLSIFGGGDSSLDDQLEPEESPASVVVGSDDGAPGVPSGFEALSIHFEDLEEPADTQGPYALTMPLLEQVSDGRNLGLYAFEDGRWVRVSPATLVNNGNSASGEVEEMPSNLAVLRLLDSAVQITGWLAPDAEPDPEALDVLTTVNTLNFAPNPDGSLSGDARGVEGASGNLVPTVRAADTDTGNAVNAILAAPALLEEHVTALVQLSLQQGNAGIDIDYPVVNAARRADFTAFITTLATQLHEANRTLSVTLPSPARSGVSWDTGAYDWEEIAAQADLVKLRTNADPTLYFTTVDEVLNHLATLDLDLGKVALVVNRESIEQGADGLASMSLLQALSLASEIEVRTASTITPNSSVVIVGRNIFEDDGASGLVWSDEARAVTFQYPGAGGMRTVWLENSLSLGFKLELAASYELAGVALSNISADPNQADFWGPLRAYGETGSVQPAAANSVMLRPIWEAQAGNSEPEARGNMVWTAPSQPGTYEVTLIVSDGVILASRSIQLDVVAPAP